MRFGFGATRKSSKGDKIGFGALLAAGIAALASSACCLLPLILVMLGRKTLEGIRYSLPEGSVDNTRIA